MVIHHWRALLLACVVLASLGGCHGNYRFNDHSYRPFGDVQVVHRGE